MRAGSVLANHFDSVIGFSQSRQAAASSAALGAIVATAARAEREFVARSVNSAVDSDAAR
jgi:hypothetical protein